MWVFVFGTLPFMDDSPDDLFDRIVEGEIEWPERVSRPAAQAMHDWRRIGAGLAAPHSNVLDVGTKSFMR